MTDLIKLLEDCVHPIKLIDEGNHCEKRLLERIDVAINELKQVKNLAIHDVVVPKGMFYCSNCEETIVEGEMCEYENCERYVGK